MNEISIILVVMVAFLGLLVALVITFGMWKLISSIKRMEQSIVKLCTEIAVLTEKHGYATHRIDALEKDVKEIKKDHFNLKALFGIHDAEQSTKEIYKK